MPSLYERYFVYSAEQKDELIKSLVVGTRPKLGTVIVNGVAKEYTDILIDMSKARFSDTTLVIKGDIRKLKFTKPEL